MLCQWQQLYPIVLLETGVVAQIAFEDLVNSFHLAICLGVKSSRYIQVHSQVLHQLVLEPGNEHRASVRNNVRRQSM